MTIVYDGSFEGFLTVVYDVYYSKLNPNEILKEEPKTLMLDEILFIDRDHEKERKVLEALKSKFSKKHFETVCNIFFCDTSSFEIDLLAYIILGFKEEKQLDNINNKCVFTIQNLERELFRLYHRMCGFIRFEELDDGTLYGKIESKFNIALLLGKHFLQRFNNQKYIIHDIKREIAFVKSETAVSVEKVASFEEPTLSQNEEKFRKLWMTFFDSVAIENRKNLKLQQSLVPLIYRTYMSEFNTI